ncbi:MAG: hypothetical protein WC967_15755 [Balneolaceae bacterium]
MNKDEYKYDFVYKAIKDIPNINIVTDVPELMKCDNGVLIDIGDETFENRLSEGRVINGSGTFEISLWYKDTSKRKSDYNAEIRKNLGDLKDNLINKLYRIAYPIKYTNTINSTNNYKIVIYGLRGFQDLDGTLENVGRKQTTFYFDYELTYL